MDEIHHAFRRLAKMWHPDRYTSAPAELRASAERRMRTLTRAYAVLGDDIERSSYDRRHGLRGATVAPPSDLWVGHHDYQHVYHQPPAGAYTPIHHQDLNGAGMFAGVLCSVLAFGLLGRLIVGGLNVWEAALVTLLLLGLMLLAGLFFTSESQLAEKAREWAEGEPKGMRDPTAHAEQQYHKHAKRHHEQQEEDEDAELAAFNALVDEALAGIPDDFKQWMENVVVQVEDTPRKRHCANRMWSTAIRCSAST